MHTKKVVTAGKKIGEAKRALIMLHGRGAGAGDILGLADHLAVSDFALLAPEATNHTWYPYSFLASPSQNEPWLTSAIELLSGIVADINAAGIASENIFFAGFSQGASLTLEFATRFARRWGGVAAFTGGLIGDKIYPERYRGDFENTPVFIGTSDPDPHVPVQRVRASGDLMQAMGAQVAVQVYPGLGHTINEDEIAHANALVFGKSKL